MSSSTRHPSPGRDGYHHPRGEDEVASIVRAASRTGTALRVRGAAHSVREMYETDLRRRGFERGGLDVCLDRIADVAIDADRREVAAGAGVHFGRDPRDPTGRAVETASLCHQLDARGLALPVLGGVSQQTVAGFFATGSEGGSIAHALSSQLVGMTLVDGTGAVRELTRERDGDLFLAAGTSLGLLGVVTRVRLRVVPRFDVEGSEQTHDAAEAEVDLLARDRRGLAPFLREHEYARLLWWPQPGVDRLVVWKAARATGEAPSVPYRPFPTVLGSTRPMQAAAGAALHAIDRALAAGPRSVRAALGEVLPLAYRAFVPMDDAPRRFRDAWHRAIPLDDEMDERLLPTAFTELWVPLDAAPEAMRRLREHYALGGIAATSTFATELYAAPSSPFWMHPGHGRDSLRVNAFWFGRNAGDPRRFFDALHDALGDLEPRLHWGKHLSSRPDPARLRARYPRWDDFLRVRAELDPNQVFVNDYLRAHLGIPERTTRVSMAFPEAETPQQRPDRALDPRTPSPAPSSFPLLFSIEPTDPSFAARASMRFDHRAVIDAPIELAFDAFAELHDAGRWLDRFRGVSFRTDETCEVGAVVDETMDFMTIRVRVVARERPFRQVWSVDGCSLPLASRMLEEVTITPRDDGRLDFRWAVFFDPLLPTMPFQSVALAFFDRFFARSTDRFRAYAEARAREERDAREATLASAIAVA